MHQASYSIVQFGMGCPSPPSLQSEFQLLTYAAVEATRGLSVSTCQLQAFAALPAGAMFVRQSDAAVWCLTATSICSGGLNVACRCVVCRL